jgi:hypothetical protein
MIIRSSFILALALPLIAQDKVAPIKAGSVASFYKAYFLDKEGAKDKKSTAKAIELYTAFLSQNKGHKLAGRAAANCVVLLYANGDSKKADAFGAQYGKVMADAEASDGDAGSGMMSMFGRRGGQQQDNPNQAQVDKLMSMHEGAEGATKDRIGRAITRLGGGRELMMARFRGGGAGGFGGRGGGGFGGRGSRGGSRGFTKPNIAEMSQDEAVKAVETMVSALERQIDSMAQRGQADEADALEEKVDKIQDLVDEGKLKEAQKMIDALEVGSSRGQQSRRRRGGDNGDAGGAGGSDERRRRRGGDTGGAGGEEVRRRRR